VPLPSFRLILARRSPRQRAVPVCRGRALLILLAPLSAFAVLGGDLNSVVSDQVRLQGTLQTTQMASFTLHEIRASLNLHGKEFS
jgi:hypothetical protein